MLAAISGPGPLAKDIAQDLTRLLADVPDSTLKSDWPALCNQIRADILVTPERTLERLNAIRLDRIYASRAWRVGSRANLDQLDTAFDSLMSDLPSVRQRRPHIVIRARLTCACISISPIPQCPTSSDFTIRTLPAV